VPKLYEYLGIVILFYSNEHEPIHVHGKYQDCESKAEFLIKDGRVIKINIIPTKGKESLHAKELREFKRFISIFKDEIVQKWIDYFVYHKEIKCVKIDGKVK